MRETFKHEILCEQCSKIVKGRTWACLDGFGLKWVDSPTNFTKHMDLGFIAMTNMNNVMLVMQ